MINTNLPLELDDGTPVTLVRLSDHGTVVVRFDETPSRGVKGPLGHIKGQTRCYHVKDGVYLNNENDPDRWPRLRNKGAVNTKLPMELEDGTPVELVRVDSTGKSAEIRLLRRSNTPGFTPTEAGIVWSYYLNTGEWAGDETKAKLRNKIMTTNAIDPTLSLRMMDGRRVVVINTDETNVDVRLAEGEPTDPEFFTRTRTTRSFKLHTGRSIVNYCFNTDYYLVNDAGAGAGRAFDPTKPVTTRDGRAARIICTDSARTSGGSFGLPVVKWPIVALVTGGTDSESPLFFMANGRANANIDSPLDLINPVERKVIRRKFKMTPGGNIQLTAYADRMVGEVEFTVEDGKLVDVKIVS